MVPLNIEDTITRTGKLLKPGIHAPWLLIELASTAQHTLQVNRKLVLEPRFFTAWWIPIPPRTTLTKKGACKNEDLRF